MADRMRQDICKAVLAGDAAVAALSRDMAYILHVAPKGEGTSDGSGLSMETQRRVAEQARPMAWRQVGHLVAAKGMQALREELLAERRIVTQEEVEEALQRGSPVDADAYVRERLALALSRRTFHAILGKLVLGRPSLLGSEPAEWRNAWAEKAISASEVSLLVERGWVVIDGAVDATIAAGACAELRELHHRRRLRVSSSVINQGACFTNLRFAGEEERAHLRLCLPSLYAVSALLCALPDALAAKDGTGLLAGLRVDPTTKLLANAPGVRHQTHLDWKGGDCNLRMVSCLLYINEADFGKADGGALRLYTDLADEGAVRHTPPAMAASGEEAPHVDLAPLAGRLVLFLSRRIWHEALPASRDRYGMTLWVPALPTTP